MQKPSIGRIVLVSPVGMALGESNGATEAAAVITRVWADNMVNVRILLDGNDTPWRTSVTLVEDAAAAEGHYACWWPPRV